MDRLGERCVTGLLQRVLATCGAWCQTPLGVERHLASNATSLRCVALELEILVSPRCQGDCKVIAAISGDALSLVVQAIVGLFPCGACATSRSTWAARVGNDLVEAPGKGVNVRLAVTQQAATRVNPEQAPKE